MLLSQDLILIIAGYVRDGATFTRLCQVKPFLTVQAQDNNFWLHRLQREFGQRYSLDLPLLSEWEPLCPAAQAYFQLLAPCPLRRTDIDEQGCLWHMISKHEFEQYSSGKIDWNSFPQVTNIKWSRETNKSARALWTFLRVENRNGNQWLVFQGPQDITSVQHHHVPFDEDPGTERNHLVYLRAGCLEIFTINITPEGEVTLAVSSLLKRVTEYFRYMHLAKPRVQLFEELYTEEVADEDIFFYLFRTQDGAIHYRDAPFVNYDVYEESTLEKIKPGQGIDCRNEYTLIRVLVTTKEISVIQYFDDNEDARVLYKSIR